MTPNQSRLVELALRTLGNHNLTWHSKMDQTHGVEMAAINLLENCHELAEVTTAARRLYVELD